MNSDSAAAVTGSQRRWPWFVVGVLLGGGALLAVWDTSHSRSDAAPLPFTIEGVVEANTSGVGSVGLWNEDAAGAEYQITLQGGTLKFTVARTFRGKTPQGEMTWLTSVPQDAPFVVSEADASNVDTSQYANASIISYAITLDRAAAKADVCHEADERSWPLTISLRHPDGGLIASEVVEVRVLCDFLLPPGSNAP